MPLFAHAAVGDIDNDGLSDAEEKVYYTDPTNPDTDGDGYPDGVEIAHGYSPRAGNAARIADIDMDNDGANDWVEHWFQSDLNNPDSDGDGMGDFEEIMHGYSPIQGENIKRFETRIDVDKTVQQMHYVVDRYMRVKTYLVSTGNPWTETPSGEFDIIKKIANKPYVGADYYYPDVPWNFLFKQGGYYIHGSWWHNTYGRITQSHGCINLSIADAKELYQYADVGTKINIYGQTPPRRVVGL